MGTSGGSTVSTQSDSRYYGGSVPADLGYLAWSYAPALTQGLTAVPTSGRLELVRLPRVPAGTVTNIVFQVTTAGSTLTSGQCFAVLYSAGGAKLGITADQSVAWASTGRKVMALTSPYANPANQDLYAGFWFVGTTGPTLCRMSNVASTLVNGGLASPNLFYASADTGLTTTAPDPFGAQTGGTLTWWVALS